MWASFNVAYFSFLLLVSMCSNQVSCEVYQITSTSGDRCPMDPCLTLSQFTNQSDSYLNDNTTLIFQPGNHSLNSVLSVSHITMLSMHTSSSNTVIMCNGLGRFDLSTIPVVHVRNITFIGCPGNKVESVQQFTLEYTSFIGQENAPGTALELIDTTASLCNNTFISNSGKQHQYYLDGNIIALAGGAILSTRSNINITESWFKGNHAQMGGAIFSEFQSNITITNSTFLGNVAKIIGATGTYYGGALYAVNGGTVIIEKSLFANNRSLDGYGIIGSGGVLYATRSLTIMISHSQFINNYALKDGGVLSALDRVNISINNSVFVNNHCDSCYGGVAYIQTDVNMVVSYSQFTNNSGSLGGVIAAAYRTKLM